MPHPTVRSASLGRGLVVLVSAMLATVSTAAPSGARATAISVPLSPCVDRDNGSPVITDVSLDHRVVDVRRHAAAVHVTVTAHDTGGPGHRTGIRGGYVGLENDDAEYTESRLRSIGNHRFVATFVFPAHAGSQYWFLSTGLHDRAGNAAGMSDRSLDRAGFPSWIGIRSSGRLTMALHGFTFGARTVDTRRHAVSVRVGARVSSDARLAGARLSAQPVKGHGRLTASLHAVRGSNGLFRGRLRVPRWQGTGTWRLSLTARTASNPTESWTFGPRQLAGHHLRASFDMLSGTDTRPVKLLGLSGAPGTVDATTSAGSEAFTLHLADARSGVARVEVRTEADGDSGLGTFSSEAVLHRTGGSAGDGTWTGEAVVPVCRSYPGTWSWWVTAWDAAGNRHIWRPSALRQIGLPSTFDMLAADHAAPDFVAGKRQRILTVTFEDDVVGISNRSVQVYRGPEMINDFEWTSPSPPRNGTWACQDKDGMTTDCRVGPVRTAVFTPADGKPFDTVLLNPDHSLGVRDLAGNAYDHDARRL